MTITDRVSVPIAGNLVADEIENRGMGRSRYCSKWFDKFFGAGGEILSRGSNVAFLVLFFLVTTLCCGVALIVFVPHARMKTFEHLERFNSDTAKITAARGHDEHELDLVNLRQFDESLRKYILTEILHVTVCIAVIILICFQFALNGRKKCCCQIPFGLIFLILICIQVAEIVVAWIFVNKMSNNLELENEISNLFTSAADKNEKGFEAIQEIFSCKGYETPKLKKEKVRQQTCTHALQETILRTQSLSSIVIIILVLKIIVLLINLFYCALQIYKHRDQQLHQNIQPPAVCQGQNSLRNSSSTPNLTAAEAFTALGRRVSDQSNNNEEEVKLLERASHVGNDKVYPMSMIREQ